MRDRDLDGRRGGAGRALPRGQRRTVRARARRRRRRPGPRTRGCLADRIAAALLPLALVAAGAALLLPSEEATDRSDLVLAALVALTALGIAPRELWELRGRWQTVVALSLAPFAVLVPLACTISRLFESPVREGVLTLGMSSTEVAAVGLVALAAGDAALALGALTGSLIAAATVGPVLIGLLADTSSGVDTGSLLGRFALVVLANAVSARRSSRSGAGFSSRWPRALSASSSRPPGAGSGRSCRRLTSTRTSRLRRSCSPTTGPT